MVFAEHNTDKSFFRSAGILFIMCVAFVFVAFQSVWAAEAGSQKTFGSPDEAAGALIKAARVNDTSELLAIFGPGAADLVSSGDEVEDRAGRRKFAELAGRRTYLAKEREDKYVLYVGNRNWPLPIPIVRDGAAWRFDTEAGKEEMLNRRIGKNELSAIEVCRAYVKAQREYAAKDRDGDGILEFAQKAVSSRGQRDGLCRLQGEKRESCHMGPLFAAAMAEGYRLPNPGDEPSPYHGYFYKILTAQGNTAPGGEKDYVVGGNMVGGFALVAYPARYGASGIMTFIVSRQGIVFQKDLGAQTEETAKNITRYNPDDSWKPVE